VVGIYFFPSGALPVLPWSSLWRTGSDEQKINLVEVRVMFHNESDERPKEFCFVND
jgi:hypothetical protein